MIYVMSDLHGCYEKYMQMLEKIQLKKDDRLYILGDVTDRGEHGIKILIDMMTRPNIFPLLGNHEYMAYRVLKKFCVEITEQNHSSHLDSDAMEMYENWMLNGGLVTLQEFSKLDKQKKEDVLDYLGEFELYEDLEVNGKNFLLVHGGLADFDECKDISEYSIFDIICERCDYSKQYYPDKYLITGHTPTYTIDPEYKGKIYRKNNHIAIDCGVIYSGILGCICLDTFEEFYL